MTVAGKSAYRSVRRTHQSLFKRLIFILFPQKAKEISQSCKKEFEEVLTRLRSDPDTKRYTEVDQAIGYLVRRIDGQLEHMCAKCGEPR